MTIAQIKNCVQNFVNACWEMKSPNLIDRINLAIAIPIYLLKRYF